MSETYGIFLIATGNYTQYLKNTIKDIKTHFFPKHKKIILLSTDNEHAKEEYVYLIDENFKIYVNKISHLGYPSDTLYRFDYFLRFEKNLLKQTTHLCFMNVNVQINEIIDESFFWKYDLFFISHPENKNRDIFLTSVETNKENSAYLDKTLKKVYVCGGFYGGKTKNFLEMCNVLKKKIIINDLNNMCAKWHDESHLNWYCYNYIEKLNILINDNSVMEKIKPINKNHKLVRSHNYQIIGWSGNILNDILNGCKIYCNGHNVGYQFSNFKYNNSRQGLLKNFFRVENKMKIAKYPTNVTSYIINDNRIKEFSSLLNINFNSKIIRKFQKKYKDHIGAVFFNLNIVNIKEINEKYGKKVLFYRPKKTENNLIKILSLNKIISDDLLFEKIYSATKNIAAQN